MPRQLVFSSMRSMLLVTLGACGYFQPVPPPVPFDAHDAPTGQGWSCTTWGEQNASHCERDVLTCARGQRATPGSSACFDWKKPAFCFSYVEDSGTKHVECSATKEYCTDRSDFWRAPGPSTVKREQVSMCQDVL